MKVRPIRKVTAILAIYNKGKRRLNRLKDEGVRYDAEIVGFYNGAWYGSYSHGDFASGAKAECAYINQMGERQLVRSRLYVMRMGDGAEGLHAMVYVDRDDPDKYEVEVFRKGVDKA
ncbi:MAG: hypothetical protein FWE21_04245 [Defluviitaleaceae bacterium]|nr:hypothetical protein [Defluviitaleaceae bacterium]